LDAYRNLEEYAKLEELAADLAKQYPDSKRLFAEQEFALNGLGLFAQADALSQGLLERLPNDLDAMRALVTTATTQENYVLARDRGMKISQAGKAEATDLNGIAWTALFTGKVDQTDLDSAIKGAQMSQNGAAVLHTLGCVYADMGNTKQAREVLIQAMDVLSLDEPDSDYWYAFGRIAEQYGEREVALQDYKRVEKPSNAPRIPSSSYRLAQIRLSAMQQGSGN
jgi:tetratricopeptide (TPR) repeat protein